MTVSVVVIVASYQPKLYLVCDALRWLWRRYHYNVSPDRLDVHVRKGWADRLHITSVGSCQGLWALIMDSNAGYTAQV